MSRDPFERLRRGPTKRKITKGYRLSIDVVETVKEMARDLGVTETLIIEEAIRWVREERREQQKAAPPQNERKNKQP